MVDIVATANDIIATAQHIKTMDGNYYALICERETYLANFALILAKAKRKKESKLGMKNQQFTNPTTDILQQCDDVLFLAEEIKKLDINVYLKICHYEGNKLAEFLEILKKAERKKEIKLGIYRSQRKNFDLN